MTQVQEAVAPSPSETPPRRRWPVVALTVGALVVGFIAGAGASSLYIVSQVRHIMQHPEEAPARITARLDSRLDLSPEQEQAIRGVLRNRFKHLHQALYTAWPVVDQVLDQIGDDIRFELNDEQKAEWDELYPDIREKWFQPPPDPRKHPIWD